MSYRNAPRQDPLVTHIIQGDVAGVKRELEYFKPSQTSTKKGPNGEGYLALATKKYLKNPTESRKKIFGLIVRKINALKSNGHKVTLYSADDSGRTVAHELAEHAQNRNAFTYARQILKGLDESGRAWPLAQGKVGAYVPKNSSHGGRALHRASSILYNRNWHNLGNANRPKTLVRSGERSVLNRRNRSTPPAARTSNINDLLRAMHLNSEIGIPRNRNSVNTGNRRNSPSAPRHIRRVKRQR
jgi:hypothetical protein